MAVKAAYPRRLPQLLPFATTATVRPIAAPRNKEAAAKEEEEEEEAEAAPLIHPPRRHPTRRRWGKPGGF